MPQITWEGIIYTLQVDGTAWVTGYDVSTQLTNIVLPEDVSIEGTLSTVTSIAPNAFLNSSLQSISFPESLTSIGDQAFRNCDNLTSITIPSSVLSVGANAFANCAKLESAYVHNTTVLHSTTFAGSTSSGQPTRITIQIKSFTDMVYTGTVRTPQFFNSPVDTTRVFTTTPPSVVNAGTYVVTGITSANYTYTLPTNRTFQVTKAVYSETLSINSANVFFDNAAHYVSVNTSTPEALTLTITYTNDSGEPVTNPTLLGVYSITVESNNYTYRTTPAELVIQKRQYTFSILTNTVEYTDESLPVAIVYGTPGFTGTVYYSGVNVVYPYTIIPPRNKGAYLITVVSSNSLYDFVASDTPTYTITHATAIVTFAPNTLIQMYNEGDPIEIEYTASRPVKNRPVNTIVTYDGSTEPPTEVGTYAVSVVVDDSDVIGSESGTLTVLPRLVTITLGNLVQTYTSEPIPVTYSPDYPRPIVILYDGLSDPPIEAGEYTVFAYVDQTSSLNYVGTTTATLTINKAPASITLYDLSQPYKESGNLPYALTLPVGLIVEYTYNTKILPKNVGSYYVTATIRDTNYAGTVSDIFEITFGIAYIKISNLIQAYTGAPITANIMTYPYGLDTIVTYNGESNPPINPGTYMVGVTIDDSNVSGFSYDILTIPKFVATVTLSNLSQTYTGGYLSTTVITNPPKLSTITLYNNTHIPPSSVGSYSVVTTIDDAVYSGTASNTFVIRKAPASIQFAGDYVYTGSYISTTATTSPPGLGIQYTYKNSTTPINAGLYDVTAIIEDESYSGTGLTTLTVQKASTPITFYSTVAIYTGAKQRVLATTSLSDAYIEYKYYSSFILKNSAIYAGEYTVTASVLSNLNYGGYASTTFIILKGNVTVEFSATAFQIPYSKPVVIKATTLPRDLGVSYLYSSITYYSSTQPTDVGTYTVIGEVTDNSNWSGFGYTTLTIVKGNGVIQFPKTSVYYTGEPLPISTIITASASGVRIARNASVPILSLSTSILYNGFSSPPINIGTYSVQATIDDAQWQGTATLQNYTIERGIPIIQLQSTFAPYSIPYSMSTSVSPNTLTPTYLYSNETYISGIPPTNVGTYTVSATIDTDLYYGVSTGQLVIQKYPETVYIAGRTQIYTGKPVTPYLVTDIPNIMTQYSYVSLGNTIPRPSAIGDYTVSANLVDDNYEGQVDNVPFSVVIGPPTSLAAYPVDTGAILLWMPPIAPPSAILQYTVCTIPSVVPPFTTAETFVRISTLTNGVPYRFTVTPSYPTGTGLPYQAYIAPFAGTGAAGHVDDEEALATMNTPADIAFDSARNLYVADTLNGVIRKIDKNGTVTTFATDCGEPHGIVIDSAYIYVSDAKNHVLYKISLANSMKTTIAGAFGQSGMENGPAATFNTPKGIALYNISSLLVADSGNHAIRSINLTSRIVTTVAGAGVAGNINAQGQNAAFDTPSGIAVDSRNNIYVADTGNHTVRKIDATVTRNVATLVGSTEGFRDGENARFTSPSRIAVDPHDNLFVSDTGNNVIRKVHTTERSVTTLVGYGKAGMAQGLGTSATLYKPQGLAWDSDMNLYVADSYNHAIRKITFTPVATTIPAPGNIYSPLPPYNLSIINNIENVVLSWTPVQQPVLPLSGYRIAYDDKNIELSRTATSATITGLSAEKNYTFSVYAVNVFGESVAVSVSIIQIVQDVVFQIENVTQYYTGELLEVQITTSPPGLDKTVTYNQNPIAIGEYTGTVSVNTGVYVGSATFTLTILDPTPTPVRDLVAKAGDRSAIIRWNAPVYSGRGAIVYYTITVNPPDVPSVTTPNNTTESVTFTGLQNTRPYTFTVTAYNYYSASDPVDIEGIPKGVPLAPRNVFATTDLSGIVTVQWDAPESDGGEPITSYIISEVGAIARITVQDTSYTFTTGLRGGYSYMFEVRARNVIGTGPASMVSNSVIPLTPPERPTVSAIRGFKKATVSWTIPNSGGRPITSFVIQTSPATRVYTTLEGASTQYEMYDLDDRITYSFNVYGVNEIGNGEAGSTPFLVGKPVAPTRGNRPSWFS